MKGNQDHEYHSSRRLEKCSVRPSAPRNRDAQHLAVEASRAGKGLFVVAAAAGAGAERKHEHEADETGGGLHETPASSIEFARQEIARREIHYTGSPGPRLSFVRFLWEAPGMAQRFPAQYEAPHVEAAVQERDRRPLRGPFRPSASPGCGCTGEGTVVDTVPRLHGPRREKTAFCQSVSTSGAVHWCSSGFFRSAQASAKRSGAGGLP